jgi:hypothetical protein
MYRPTPETVIAEDTAGFVTYQMAMFEAERTWFCNGTHVFAGELVMVAVEEFCPKFETATTRSFAPVQFIAGVVAVPVCELARAMAWASMTGKAVVWALMVKGELAEVPPPGAGLKTATWAVPADVMSAAVTAACNCVALTNVVVRFAPFHWTTELLMNPLPLTVSVKAAPPAVALVGEIEVIAGTGLGAVMVNGELPEVPPPGAGLKTATCAVPAAAMSAAVTAACNCIALT